MTSNEVYLAGAVRTPIGTFGGAFEPVPATGLGSTAARHAAARAGLPSDQVDEVIFGNVVGAGLGQNVARQVAIGAGFSPGTCATSVNKVCGSGLKAVMMAAQAIKAGDAAAIVAGGTENMSRAPYLLEKARYGYRLGNGELVDSMIRDGLWDIYNNMHMGMCGDRTAERYGFTREQQDDYAVSSFTRALAAMSKGAFVEQIQSIPVRAGKETIVVTEDENPRKFNEDKLRKLRPAFGEKGTVTAGNASSINDGAAAIVVMSAGKVAQLGVKPQARILGYASFAREPEWFTLAPVGALQKLLNMLSLKIGDIDLFEINEAFSVVPLVAMRDLAIPHEKVNVHGGAVALGHPIGASGARTLVTLIHALKERGGKIGVDSLCIGGGMAVAMAIELC
ncbi:MAG TPA: thiolase family protein [Patescibacteria group bacterium]|nr:thiolase family protein [Patescibacteria group bacterium]